MHKNKKRKLKDLFIEDLGQVVGGKGRGRCKPYPTTLAIGEEDVATTLAIGEEDDGGATTLALGEEDGGI